MKVRLNLGVASKKDLLDHRRCFEAGQAVRRLEDTVVFSTFMLREGEKEKFSEKELHLISAGIHSAAGLAEMGIDRVVPEKKDEAKKLATSAKNLNNKIRTFLNKGRDGSAPKEITAEESKKLSSSVDKLLKRVQDFSSDVEKLCYVESKAKAPALKGNGNVRMGHAGAVIEKPTMIERPRMILKPRVIDKPAMIERPVVLSGPPGEPTLPKRMYPSFSRPAFHKAKIKGL